MLDGTCSVSLYDDTPCGSSHPMMYIYRATFNVCYIAPPAPSPIVLISLLVSPCHALSVLPMPKLDRVKRRISENMMLLSAACHVLQGAQVSYIYISYLAPIRPYAPRCMITNRTSP